MRTGRKSLLVACLALTVTQVSWGDSLKDIYESALQNDPVLRAARATYLAGKENLAQGRAGLLPQIIATASYAETTTDSNSERLFLNQQSISDTESDTDTTNYALQLSQAVFDMPAWFRFQSGKALSASARAQFSSDQQSLIVRVSDAYFNVLRAYDDLETRKAEERAIHRQLEQTKERFDVGLLPITDVHEAQAAYDDAVVNSLESRGALNIAFEQLEVLTGQSHYVLAGLAEKFPAARPDPATSDAWVEFALTNNYQLKVAELSKDASHTSAKAQKYEHLPKLTLSLGYDKRDSEGTQDGVSGLVGNLSSLNNEPFDETTETSSIALNLNMPLYSGGLLHSQRRQSAHLATQSTENYIATKRNTVQSARSQHQLVVTNSARVKARKQSITSAESALEATQAGYEVGTRNIVDVLVAQRTLYQARRNYANARYDYILSMMRLREVAGQLSPEDVYQLNAWLDPQLVINKASAQ